MSLSTFQSGQKLSSEHNIRIKNLYFFRGKIIRKSTLHDLYIYFYHTASLARHIRYLRKQVHKYYIIVFRTVWLSIISTKQNVSSNAFWQRHNKNVKACKNGHPNHLSDHCQDYLQKQFETLYNLKSATGCLPCAPGPCLAQVKVAAVVRWGPGARRARSQCARPSRRQSATRSPPCHIEIYTSTSEAVCYRAHFRQLLKTVH